MSTPASDIQVSRIQHLNDKPLNPQGNYVLYWMQASQRVEHNYALEFAIQKANELSKPLLVAFGLMDDYPEANLRHYTFMLQGLADVQESLHKRTIKMIVQHGLPDTIALQLGKNAAVVITDRGYLKIQKLWREQVASKLGCQLIQIEDNVVVPVDLVTNKTEYAARTIRPKILQYLESFLLTLEPTTPKLSSLDLELNGVDLTGFDLSDPSALAQSLKLDKSVSAVSQFFKGGESEAKRTLKNFLENHFTTYSQNRNQPQTNDTSYMAMYLHFGQISPIYITLEIRASNSKSENTESFIEELVVRRELAMNFVTFTPDYDSYSVVPDWAKKTLQEHEQDIREYIYTSEQLETAQTHDPYWNAAMNEMRSTGYMHNYMRMYWAKKILEWTTKPQTAFETTLYLNNKYFLDGRDANSYTGVAWCYGVHDRAWTERKVFGKIRYMNANGLKRKAKPDDYVKKVNALMERATGKASKASKASIQDGLF